MIDDPQSPFFLCDTEVTEVSFLIPVAKAEALERQAARSGLTLGELLRRMIASHPKCQSCDRFSPIPCQTASCQGNHIG